MLVPSRKQIGDDPADHSFLDLHDLALLLTHERYTVEPRFRHAKLVDVAHGRDDFASVQNIGTALWYQSHKRHLRTGFIFEVAESATRGSDERDLPTNMVVPSMVWNPRTRALSDRELETIFYQARMQDSCYASVALLQHLFALYADAQPLRVRTETGAQFVTTTGARRTAKFTLHGPRRMVMSVVSSAAAGTRAHYTGEMEDMPHIGMAFAPHDAVLDLSALQFGATDGGRALFVLEPLDAFTARMRRVAERVEGPVFGGPMDLRPHHDWLAGVARRVQARYARRQEEHWCGHCGAPDELMACKRCRQAWYCGRDHQVAAWPFHKHWCAASTP